MSFRSCFSTLALLLIVLPEAGRQRKFGRRFASQIRRRLGWLCVEVYSPPVSFVLYLLLTLSSEIKGIKSPQKCLQSARCPEFYDVVSLVVSYLFDPSSAVRIQLPAWDHSSLSRLYLHLLLSPAKHLI